MAIAWVGKADLGNNGGSGSLTPNYTVGSGTNRLLVLEIAGDATSDNVATPTFNSVNGTLVAKLAPTTGSTRWLYLYYWLNPASGTNAFSITTSAGYLLATCADYDGVKQQAPEAFTTNSGTTTSLTTTVTTVSANDWLMMAYSSYSGGVPPTAGAGTLLRIYGAAYGDNGLFDSNGSVAAGANSLIATNSTGRDFDVILAAFAPDTGGSSRGLFRTPPVSGVGIGASFFRDPLQAPMQMVRRDRIFVPAWLEKAA